MSGTDPRPTAPPGSPPAEKATTAAEKATTAAEKATTAAEKAATAAEKNAAPTENALRRAREGTEIVDQVGHFQITGDRVVFFSEPDNRRFVSLENLNLERVARTIADRPEPLQWKISGLVTEFRGSNFLLIQRAILRGKSDVAKEKGM